MRRKNQDEDRSGDTGLGSIFRGLGGFLDLVSNLVEKGGGELSRSGQVGDDKKGVKAVYGFTFRVGGEGQPSVERFGNVKDDAGGPIVDEVREPMVDVFDEGDHLLLIAELPGVSASDIKFEVKQDILDLNAHNQERKYHKEVLLSSAVTTAGATRSYRNGILELKLPKEK